MKAVQKANSVVTGKIQLDFPMLFEKAKKYGSDEVGDFYTATVVIDKSDADTVEAVKGAIREELPTLTKKCGGKLPKKYDIPLRDADTYEDQNGEILADKYPYLAGKYIIRVKSKFKVPVVNSAKQPADESEVFSGSNARVSLRFYSYSNQRTGIGAGLGAVQILPGGEPFIEDQFAALDVFDAVEGVDSGDDVDDLLI